MKRNCRVYIDDIIEAIEKIERYVEGVALDNWFICLTFIVRTRRCR